MPESAQMPFFDKLGQEIKAGDFVAYGCNLDRSAGLQLGKVIGFLPDKIRIVNESGTKVALSFPERMVVVSALYNQATTLVVPHYDWDKTPKIMPFQKDKKEVM